MLASLGALVSVVLVWWLVSLVVPSHPIDSVPSPELVGQGLWRALGGSTLYGSSLYADVAESLKEGVGGWVVGCGVAIVVGALIARVAVVRELLFPVIEILRPISALVWVPLAIVWFGLGYPGKLFVVSIAVFFVVILYVIHSMRHIDAELTKVADVVGLSGIRRFILLTAMGSLGEIATGMRIALMTGWGTVMIAELVASTTGLGALEIYAQQSYSIAGVMEGMVGFAAIGLALNALFSAAERKFLPWSVKVRTEMSR